MSTKQSDRRIKVWDLPTRVFHWGLVGAIVAAWLTNGSSRQLDIHVFAGYVAAGLVLFRLVWGALGGKYARFRSFIFSPGAYREHLRSLVTLKPTRHIGHNPLGGLAIFLILGLVAMISISGILALGGAFQQGPLANLFGFAAGDVFKEVHEFLAWSLAAVVAFHIGGVIFESALTKENLVAAMIHGFKAGYSKRRASASFTVLGVALLGTLATATGADFLPYFQQTKDHPYQPFKGPQLARNQAWDKECGGCHLAYHPSLLPSRSWDRIFAQQDQHFGEDLALDADTINSLLAYAHTNSAENHQTRAAWKIDRSAETQTQPTRITEIRFWRRAHQGLQDAVWRSEGVKSKANCDACHRDASSGGFQPAAMAVPPIRPRQAPKASGLVALLSDLNPFNSNRTEQQ